MRTIKFRVWEKNSKTMYYNLSFYNDNFTAVMSANRPLLKVIPMQFVGLLDKNNTEIYEGDIIQSDEYKTRGIVVYTPPSFGLQFNNGVCTEYTWEDWENFEVIGNIYETPELL